MLAIAVVGSDQRIAEHMFWLFPLDILEQSIVEHIAPLDPFVQLRHILQLLQRSLHSSENRPLHLLHRFHEDLLRRRVPEISALTLEEDLVEL